MLGSARYEGSEGEESGDEWGDGGVGEALCEVDVEGMRREMEAQLRVMMERGMLRRG